MNKGNVMYIHDSVKTSKFSRDKKLNLLKRGVITVGQFVNLIDVNDPYTIIGPAVVDKSCINEFIQEWKSNTVKIQSLQDAFIEDIKPQTILDKLDILSEIFPEINTLSAELQYKLKNTNCQVCERNKYLIKIISQIKDLYKDGRDLKEEADFINAIIDKYFPLHNKILTEYNMDEFDINWVKPDTIIGMGNDLIMGLSNCFDCCKKHIGRAKAFYEEWHQGYPEHNTLMYNEFVKANKVLEEGYVLYWDSLSQLDMASCELVGSNFGDLEGSAQVEIIELANKIRQARILFQENTEKVPNWDKLRIEVQKLQNKINKHKK